MFKDISLQGKVKVVNAFADLTVQVVDTDPDLRVQVIDAFYEFPGRCGKFGPEFSMGNKRRSSDRPLDLRKRYLQPGYRAYIVLARPPARLYSL